MMGNLKFRYSTYNLNQHIQRHLHLHRNQAIFLMRAVRDTIQKAAKERCPVDTGNLTMSITGDVIVNKNSYAATCYVPSNAACNVEYKEIKDADGKVIRRERCESPSNYAYWMHEGDYNLGENSLAKQAKLGTVVGPKYITRAIEDKKAEIVQNIKKALKIR